MPFSPHPPPSPSIPDRKVVGPSFPAAEVPVVFAVAQVPASASSGLHGKGSNSDDARGGGRVRWERTFTGGQRGSDHPSPPPSHHQPIPSFPSDLGLGESVFCVCFVFCFPCVFSFFRWRGGEGGSRTSPSERGYKTPSPHPSSSCATLCPPLLCSPPWESGIGSVSGAAPDFFRDHFFSGGRSAFF